MYQSLECLQHLVYLALQRLASLCPGLARGYQKPHFGPGSQEQKIITTITSQAMVQFILMQGHGMTNGNINVHGHLLYVNIEQLIQHLLAPIKQQPVALPLSL